MNCAVLSYLDVLHKFQLTQIVEHIDLNVATQINFAQMLTNSMQQSPSLKANSHSACQISFLHVTRIFISVYETDAFT
jgi:hypothetical protein